MKNNNITLVLLLLLLFLEFSLIIKRYREGNSVHALENCTFQGFSKMTKSTLNYSRFHS